VCVCVCVYIYTQTRAIKSKDTIVIFSFFSKSLFVVVLFVPLFTFVFKT